MNIEVLHIAYVNLKYSLPKEFIMSFHNGLPNCNYYFIIKELGEESKGQFIYLGENTEKYVTFSVLIAKEVTRNSKNGEELQNPYLTDYNIDTSILSNLVNKSCWRINVNTNMIIKNGKRLKLNTKIERTSLVEAPPLGVVQFANICPCAAAWIAHKVSEEEGSYASHFYCQLWERFKELSFHSCRFARFNWHSFAQLLLWRSQLWLSDMVRKAL